MSGSSNIVTLDQTIKFGNKNEILHILHVTNANLNKQYSRGETVLHWVYQNKNLVEKDVIEILKKLLNLGFDPNVQNDEALSALQIAVTKRSREAVDLLLRHNVKIDASDDMGNTIAHFFIEDVLKRFGTCFEIERHEQIEVESASFLEWLFSRRLCFDHINKEGDGVLELSINYSLYHITVVLLKHMQRKVDKKLIHFLIRQHANLTAFRLSEIQLTKRSRYASKIFKLLVDKDVSVDLVGRLYFRTAIDWKHDMSIVKTMVDHSLKKCVDSSSATIVFAELFECIASWDKSENKYFLSVLSTLKAQGANVNVKNKNRKTPLYHSFKEMKISVINFLNDCHADFSVITNDGNNLFHVLAADIWFGTSNDKLIEDLFDLIASKQCCDVNAIDRKKETPLFIAIRWKNLTSVQKLISFGAEVNCWNIGRQTPLHLAVVTTREYSSKICTFGVEKKTEKIVEVLLQSGAYVNRYCKLKSNVESPFSLAINKRTNQIVKLMLAYGADINHTHIINLIRITRMRPLTAVIEHGIKLLIANLSLREEYKGIVEKEVQEDKYQGLYEECLKEIEHLKKIFIDTHTSIYTYLHMDILSKCMHINNEKLKNLVNSADIKQRFPQYFILILASYRETVGWKKLLEPAKRAWNELTKVALPEECIELILAYLKIEDLVSMTEEDKNVNKYSSSSN